MTKGSREALYRDPSLVVQEREVRIKALRRRSFKDIPFYALALAFSLSVLYRESGIFELSSFKRRFIGLVSTPEGLKTLKERAWEVLERHGNPLPLYLLSFALERQDPKGLHKKITLYDRKDILDYVLLDALALARNHVRKVFKKRSA